MAFLISTEPRKYREHLINIHYIGPGEICKPQTLKVSQSEINWRSHLVSLLYNNQCIKAHNETSLVCLKLPQWF